MVIKLNWLDNVVILMLLLLHGKADACVRDCEREHAHPIVYPTNQTLTTA